MRTLKVLSLVLALVLCFGLVGTAFAGNTDKFEDADKISENCAEAVEVLIGLGIVDGKTDTTVDPTGNYTREAAAKIIAYMLLGKQLADALPKESSVFTDVANGRWSAGYIAYCYEKGIIDGVTETTFNPQGTLTGYAWAKMVLGALGYNKNGEYNDPKTWKMNVVTDALKYKIFEGDVGALADKPIQRQQAMLVAFNGLNKGEAVTAKTTVTYFVTKKGASFTSLAALQAGLAADPTDEYASSYSVEATNTVIANSLGQTVYGLNKVDSTDANGRPTTEYQVNGKAVATIATEANKVYTKAVTGGAIYKDLGLTANPTTTTYMEDNDDTAAAPGGFAVAANNNIALGGNGVEVSVYYDKTTKTVDIVVVNTYAGTVQAVAPATATAKEKITITSAGTPVNNQQFEIAGLKKDDNILVTWDAKNNKVIGVEKVEPIALKPTSFTGATVTAGGKTYQYSANAIVAPYANGAFPEANFILDKSGYIANWALIGPAAAPTEYAIFVAGGSSNDAYGNPSNVAKVIKSDGSLVELKTTANYSGGAIAAGNIVTVEEDVAPNTGKYVLTSVGAYAAVVAPATLPVNSKTVAVGTTKANEKTVFFVKTTVAGKPTYTTYTGLSKVPTMTTAAGYAFVNNATTGFAEFVYIDTPELPSAGASTIVFATTAGSFQTTDSVKGTFTTYNAVVDGKITTIEAKAGVFTAANGLYISLTKDAKGIVDGKTVMPGAGNLTAVDKTGAAVAYTAPASGVITIDGANLVVNDSTQYYQVAANGKITTATIPAAGGNDKVVYYTTGGVLSALFIIK